MKLNEALDRLDHHYQMISLWEDIHRHMQQSVDIPQKNIPVSPAVRTTLVGREVTRQAQEKVKEQIEYHRQMAEQYGDSALNPKTVPKENLLSPGEKKDDKTDKKSGTKKDAKPETKAEPKAEGPAAEPEAEGEKEAANG